MNNNNNNNALTKLLYRTPISTNHLILAQMSLFAAILLFQETLDRSLVLCNQILAILDIALRTIRSAISSLSLIRRFTIFGWLSCHRYILSYLLRQHIRNTLCKKLLAIISFLLHIFLMDRFNCY